jgi:hypothetical protein
LSPYVRIRGDDGLDVCGKTTATRKQVKAFIREVDSNACVDELTQFCQISDVSCASVNLVDDDWMRCRDSLGYLVSVIEPPLADVVA